MMVLKVLGIIVLWEASKAVARYYFYKHMNK